jgi:Zn-dependent protease
MRGGYLTIGRWRRAPVRLHWTLPLVALIFGQGAFAPGFWLGFVLIVLIHELGHAALVRRCRCAVVSIDVHGMGGVCRWSGDPTRIQRAWIAWGGVLAEIIALIATYAVIAVFGPPETAFTIQLAAAFTTTNIWMIAFNLLPMPPLDGAEAWKLPGLLFRRWRRRAQERAAGRGGFAYEREAATLDRYSGDAPEQVQGAVDEALRRIAEDLAEPEDPKSRLN